MIDVPVIAAPTDAQAQYSATTQQLKLLSLSRGNRLPLQAPVDSMDGLWSDWEEQAVRQKLAAAIVGGPQTVRQGLEDLLARTQADEIMMVSDFYEHADRLRTYEIVAALKTATTTPTEAVSTH